MNTNVLRLAVRAAELFIDLLEVVMEWLASFHTEPAPDPGPDPEPEGGDHDNIVS